MTFAWLPPSSLRSLLLKNLAPASERQGHTTSPSALDHVRLTCPQRPPHPRPTYRDDRPKRPSSSRRDAREHRCDLPDEASADTCDRLARRAIRAWHACGNCPSGSSVQAHDRGLKACGLHSRQRAHRQRDRASLIHCKRPHISSATNAAALAPWRTEQGRVSITCPFVQPSPNTRSVGVRIGSFEACSGFNRVTARWIARPPSAAFVTRLQSSQLPD